HGERQARRGHRRVHEGHRGAERAARAATREPVSEAVLSIDIGGTGIKALVLDATGAPRSRSVREATPKPATPETVLAAVERLVSTLEGYDRVSVGFPGVVVGGVTKNAPNLASESWRDVDLAA